MAEVFVYVVIQNRIYDYWFYTRELADVLFGQEEIGVALIQNTKTKKIHPSLLRIVPHIYKLCSTNHRQPPVGSQANGTRERLQPLNIVPGECCGIGATEICPVYKSTITLNADLASCITSELQRSYKFRRRFLKFVKRTSPFTFQFEPSEGKFSEIFDGIMEVSVVVEIQPIYPRQRIDFAWFFRVAGLLVKKMHLEEAMAWLSTLGGAYSSLGDYFESHAVIAGKISFSQLKVAMELADPGTIARCRLFFALSLMQLGHIDQSKMIIRRQLKLAKRMNPRDDRLIAMCRGLWSKLKYFVGNMKTNIYVIKNSEVREKLQITDKTNCILKKNGETVVVTRLD